MSTLRCDCLFLGREAERRVCATISTEGDHSGSTQNVTIQAHMRTDSKEIRKTELRRNSASREQMEEFQQIRAGAGDSTSRGIQAQRGPEQAGCCM